MNVLAFDCSLRGCAAALVCKGRVLVRGDAPTVQGGSAAGTTGGQAETLIPLLVDVLAQAKLGWPQIGLIVATVGPGSFTGLRIGLAAARGLALAGKIPAVGVTTLDAIAFSVPESERRGRILLVAIDSKRGDLFVQRYAADLAPLSPPEAMALDAASAIDNTSLLLAGDGIDILAPRLGGECLVSAVRMPDAAALAELGLVRHRAGVGLPLSPLYLRAPDVTLPP